MAPIKLAPIKEVQLSAYPEELYAHQEWADAEHWRAFESHPVALEDKAIRERLHHIHLVQHGFLWITGPRTAGFELKKIEDFPAISDLKKYGREGLAQMRDFVKTLGSARMEESSRCHGSSRRRRSQCGKR